MESDVQVAEQEIEEMAAPDAAAGAAAAALDPRALPSHRLYKQLRSTLLSLEGSGDAEAIARHLRSSLGALESGPGRRRDSGRRAAPVAAAVSGCRAPPAWRIAAGDAIIRRRAAPLATPDQTRAGPRSRVRRTGRRRGSHGARGLHRRRGREQRRVPDRARLHPRWAAADHHPAGRASRRPGPRARGHARADLRRQQDLP